MSFIVPFQLNCYPEDSEIISKLMKNFSKIDNTLLSIRILIEIIVIESPSGNNLFNIEESDKLLALSFHLFNWATVGDFYHYKILQENLRFGASGRIQIPQMRDLSSKYLDFVHEKTVEKTEGAYEFFKGEFDHEKEKISHKKDEFFDIIESAFVAEFGLNSFEIGRFFCCFIHSTEFFICEEQEGPVYRLEYSDIINRLKINLGWGYDKIQNAIRLFSLEEKEDGYNIDIETPWKFRRYYSYTRRPLLIVTDSNNVKFVIWGSLHSERSLNYIEELISEARYDSTNATPEMKKLISTIQNDKGEQFTTFIKEWFENELTEGEWFIDENVKLPINLGKSKNEAKLGDIDVLAVDQEKGVIYSIECKSLNFGRTAREIAQEIIRFYEGTKNDKSWILKHKKRDKWLKNNVNIVLEKYSLPKKPYVIKSLILTSEAIPTRYLHEVDPDIPIKSFREIEREGIHSLEII